MSFLKLNNPVLAFLSTLGCGRPLPCLEGKLRRAKPGHMKTFLEETRGSFVEFLTARTDLLLGS